MYLRNYSTCNINTLYRHTLTAQYGLLIISVGQMANLCVGSDIQHKDLNFWTKSMFRPTLLSDWYEDSRRSNSTPIWASKMFVAHCEGEEEFLILFSEQNNGTDIWYLYNTTMLHVSALCFSHHQVGILVQKKERLFLWANISFYLMIAEIHNRNV
jgi:hypothetical protein